MLKFNFIISLILLLHRSACIRGQFWNTESSPYPSNPADSTESVGSSQDISSSSYYPTSSTVGSSASIQLSSHPIETSHIVSSSYPMDSTTSSPYPSSSTPIYPSFQSSTYSPSSYSIVSSTSPIASSSYPMDSSTSSPYYSSSTLVIYPEMTSHLIEHNTTSISAALSTEDDIDDEVTITVTLPKTTTSRSRPILAANEFEFNSSIVIVWEKCGLEARTQVTQIFQSVYSKDQQVTFSYDPSINVIIYELINKANSSSSHKQVLKLPNIAGELIFFVFNEPGKVNLYFDCPSVSKHKFVMDFAVGIEYLSVIGQNSKNFASLQHALEVFKCRSSITVLTGTIIHFDGQLSLVGTSLLISFQFDKESFSLTLQNGVLIVTTSVQQLVSISLTQTITTSGLYIIFTQVGVEFHVNCPTSLNGISAAGFWNTTIFQTKLNVETSRHHYFGNAASLVLLNSFCSTNGLIGLIESGISDCIPNDKVQSNLQSVDHANQIYLNFIPSASIFEQIETFKADYTLSFGNLIENEPKILIASRDYAEPEFFNKNFNQYIEGFSDGQSNFWIGLDVMNKVTSANDYKLRVVATTTSDVDLVEEYIYFRVGNVGENFKLTVGVLALGSNGFFAKNDGAEFSTYDSGLNSLLARQYAGGYWHTQTNSYCFSCVNRNYKAGSAATVSLSQGVNVEIFKTKLYLVPKEKKVLQNQVSMSDSLILNGANSELIRLLGFNEADRFYLLYRGSRDGFTAKAFHSNCDFIRNTLTIVKSGSNIFGGFTSATWDGSANTYKPDNNAFIFSLRNNLNRPMVMKMKSTSASNAIYSNPTYGPTFGGGHDFMISDSSNVNSNSYSNLGHSYEFSLYTAGTSSAQSFLAGAYQFKVNELEVYAKF